MHLMYTRNRFLHTDGEEGGERALWWHHNSWLWAYQYQNHVQFQSIFNVFVWYNRFMSHEILNEAFSFTSLIVIIWLVKVLILWINFSHETRQQHFTLAVVEMLQPIFIEKCGFRTTETYIGLTSSMKTKRHQL